MSGEVLAGLGLFIAVIGALVLLVELLGRDDEPGDETKAHQAMCDALDPEQRSRVNNGRW